MIIKVKPMTTPAAWGSVLRTPKFAPAASSIRLLGPGVMEVTKQKTKSPESKVNVILLNVVPAKRIKCNGRFDIL